MKIIKLKDIVTDSGTQQREEVKQSVVDEYADAIKCGNKFPPVTVFFDGARSFLVDGFHRVGAYKQLEIHDIEADVMEGTERDALLYSAGVNGAHGLRLTNKDKRKAVSVLLFDDEWTEWTNRKIATHCNVTHGFVNKMRNELEEFLDGGVDTVSTPKNHISENQQVTDEEKKLSTDEDEEIDERDDQITQLSDEILLVEEENKKLRDSLATNQLPDDIEIKAADEIITELREQIRFLEINIQAVKDSRDSYLRENEQLKDQCRRQANQLKKVVNA